MTCLVKYDSHEKIQFEYNILFPVSLVAPTVTLLKYIKSNAINVKKGAAIDIPAKISGLPLPTFEWTKNGVLLDKPTETMTLESEEIDRQTINSKIAVPETVRQDTGTYKLAATNIHGTGQLIINVQIFGMILCTSRFKIMSVGGQPWPGG